MNLFTEQNNYSRYTRTYFEKAPSGDVTRQAITLTGNMFKAHKIVSSLDLRHSTVIFTDADGMRNRALLLPSNTPTDLFESSLENQVTFKQVKEIANFFNQLPVNIDFNRNNYVGTKVNFPYKKASIEFYYNGSDCFNVTVKSVAKQFNRFMSNTNVFHDPKGGKTDESLNIHFTEPGRNEFRFALDLKDVERFVDELDSTTKIEAAFLDLKSKLPDGNGYFLNEINRMLNPPAQLAYKAELPEGKTLDNDQEIQQLSF